MAQVGDENSPTNGKDNGSGDPKGKGKGKEEKGKKEKGEEGGEKGEEEEGGGEEEGEGGGKKRKRGGTGPFSSRKLSLLRISTWALSNLCDGQPSADRNFDCGAVLKVSLVKFAR